MEVLELKGCEGLMLRRLKGFGGLRFCSFKVLEVLEVLGFVSLIFFIFQYFFSFKKYSSVYVFPCFK